MTPNIPVTTKINNEDEYAYMMPVITLRIDPMMRVFLRPNLSAFVVKSKEMKMSPTMTAN